MKAIIFPATIFATTSPEFGLQNNSAFPQAAKLLSNFRKNGFSLVIRYWPDFFSDAWKIKGVSLVLELKVQNGNSHPTLDSKIIKLSAI